MKKLIISLGLEEINDILTALGNQPYVKVYQLISDIQQQAATQLQDVRENGQSKAETVENEVKEPALVEN